MPGQFKSAAALSVPDGKEEGDAILSDFSAADTAADKFGNFPAKPAVIEALNSVLSPASRSLATLLRPISRASSKKNCWPF